MTFGVNDIDLKPLVDQTQQSFISNAMLKKTPQPMPIQRVIKLLDIGVEHPIHLPPHQSDRQCIEGIVLASTWTKPVGKAQEVNFVDGTEHRGHGSDIRVMLANSFRAMVTQIVDSTPGAHHGYDHPRGLSTLHVLQV